MIYNDLQQTGCDTRGDLLNIVFYNVRQERGKIFLKQYIFPHWVLCCVSSLHQVCGSVCLQFLVSFFFWGDPKRKYRHYQQTTLLLTGQRELKPISINWVFPSILETHYAQCLANPYACKLMYLPWSWEHSFCIMQNTAKPSSRLLKLHLNGTLQQQMQSTHYSPHSLNHCWNWSLSNRCLKVDLDSEGKCFLSKASLHTVFKELTGSYFENRGRRSLSATAKTPPACHGEPFTRHFPPRGL